MPLSVVGVGTRQGTAGNIVGLDGPAGSYAANDVGYALFETANEPPSIPVGWTEIITHSPQGTGAAGGATSTRVILIAKRAANGTDLIVNVTDPGDHIVGQILVVRGGLLSEFYHLANGDVDAVGGTSVTIPSLASVVAGSLCLLGVAYAFDSVAEQCSGFANVNLQGLTQVGNCFTASGNGGGVGFAYGVKPTTGATGTTAATLLNAAVQERFIISIRPEPPAAPTERPATDVFTEDLKVNWLNGATGGTITTTVEYRPAGGGAYTVVSGIASGVTFVQLTGLTPATTYDVRVKHVDNGIDSAYWTNAAYATTDAIPPSAPDSGGMKRTTASRFRDVWTHT